MAIYHFSGTIISRSQGRSAVACAAYRSAERLHDERQDRTHDYGRKQDVVHKEIMLPEGAPAYMGDRQVLWNTVERYEKRKDAQLAREFTLALPRELSTAQNIALAREFVQQAFVDKGMIADLCIHNDKTRDGEQQPHAHVMLTLRQVTADGFCQKVRTWNAKENILQWREAWSASVNRHLFLHGHDVRVDHRTLQAQGIALEPQHKIGAAMAQERLARLADHERIAFENGQKLLAGPEIALYALTRQQSTFTHQDIARLVHRHTATVEQFQAVYAKVKASPELVYLGQDAKARERYTTCDMLKIESQMMALAEALPQRANHGVNEANQTLALNTRQLSDEQRLAFSHLTRASGLSCVVGYAGTGKSYLLGAAREAWEAQGYRVLGATLSGIAAQNLTASSGIESRTLASRFYYWQKEQELLGNKDILVIDEAGMLGSRQMGLLLTEAAKHGAKVVLLGDPEQLQAIEAGGAFRAISERTGYVELTQIRRQHQEWQKAATVELATGKTADALARYQAHDHVHAFESQALAKQGLLGLWNDVRLSDPTKTQIMLAYTRVDVRELNELARALRQAQGELGESQVFQTEQGKREFAVSDRVYCLKNDRGLEVKNGTLGTIIAIDSQKITLRLDADERKPKAPLRSLVIDTNQYNALDHGYAATIHKAQGITVDRSYVLASQYMDRHTLYVGGSRHRDSLDICYGRDVFANDQALVKTLSRERAKDISLDYTDQSYALLAQAAEKAFKAYKPAEQQVRVEQTKHYDQRLSEAAAAYDRMQEMQKMQGMQSREGLKTDRDLSKTDRFNDFRGFNDFKAQFERQNPDQALALKESIRPSHERLALAFEKRFGELEQALQQSPKSWAVQKEASQYLKELAKQPQVMDYFKTHNKTLSDKLSQLQKSHQLDRGRDIGGRSL